MNEFTIHVLSRTGQQTCLLPFTDLWFLAERAKNI